MLYGIGDKDVTMPRKAGVGGPRLYPFSMKTTKDVREKLEAAAARSGRVLSHEIEARLERSIAQEEAAGGSHTQAFADYVAATIRMVENLHDGRKWTEDERVAAACRLAIERAAEAFLDPDEKERRPEVRRIAPSVRTLYDNYPGLALVSEADRLSRISEIEGRQGSLIKALERDLAKIHRRAAHHFEGALDRIDRVLAQAHVSYFETLLLRSVGETELMAELNVEAEQALRQLKEPDQVTAREHARARAQEAVSKADKLTGLDALEGEMRALLGKTSPSEPATVMPIAPRLRSQDREEQGTTATPLKRAPRGGTKRA